ncbi:MAG: hypothetical protein Q9218_007828 [Villophora microphyllina]
MSSRTVIHLRSECKPLEYRSALTPSATKSLIEHAYTVNVERSPARIFKDEEFETAGATLVPEGSWPTVPDSHLILGLKELPEEATPLKHIHIQFAHNPAGNKFSAASPAAAAPSTTSNSSPTPPAAASPPSAPQPATAAPPSPS